MPITNTTRIIDLPTKSSLGSGDYFAVDNENGDTSKILASSVSGSSTAGLVAKEYSNAQTYGDGAIRIHVDNNVPNLYKANQDIQSPEAWTPAHWDSTDAGEEIEAANAAIASLNQNLTKCFTTTISVGCTYADSNTIGYRSLSSERVDVTTITGYPTGATILAVITTAGQYQPSMIPAFDGTYIGCSAKNSGTYQIRVTFIYTE